ncbi:MAG: cytidine deaminase [Chthoniobacteraceae bacterium]|nr:cytidine deaminase [Chthoniobacteraceae bacterium]
MNFDQLFELAWEVRQNAYAPYSNFRVGAALLTKDGKVFTGCNVENLSFGLTICAERAAVTAAIAAGYAEFVSIAIVSESVSPVSPCGACRQVLSEFVPANEDMEVRSANPAGDIFESTLNALLPRARAGILGT